MYYYDCMPDIKKHVWFNSTALLSANKYAILHDLEPGKL